jgi:hypothetical protein
MGAVRLSRRQRRVHTRCRRSLTGASLAAETNKWRHEESRLKTGCSQDWLPNERPDPKGAPANLSHKTEGAGCATGTHQSVNSRSSAVLRAISSYGSPGAITGFSVLSGCAESSITSHAVPCRRGM